MLDWISAALEGPQLVGNIIAGLLASLLTWAIIAFRERMERWRQCARFTGKYEVIRRRDGKKMSNETVEIRWLGGTVIEASADSDMGPWKSTIMLDPHVMTVGQGYWEYEGKDFVGRHDVQMAANQNDIYVFSKVPSSDRPSIALIWRRIGG